MSSDLESPEAFAERLAAEFSIHWYSEDTGGSVESTPHAVEAIRAYAESIRADERAKVVQRIAKLESEAEEVREQLQTVVDERIEIEPVLTTDELITIVEHALAKWNRRILELEAKVEAEQWISVGERLPERGEAVLVAIEGGDVEPAARDLCGDGWHTLIDVGYHDATIEGVTHWRPLPAPPTDAERKDESRG